MRAIKGDKRFKYIHQDNCGVAYARGHGADLSRGVYLCFLDADDAIAPTFLEVCVKALEGDPLLGVAYTGLMLVGRDGRRRQQSGWPPQCDFDEQIKGKNQVPTCSVMRARVWRELGGQRQRYAPQGCGTEDAAFYLSVGANGWRMRRITNEPLFLYTLGGRTWDKQNYVKTDWLAWHPFTKDKLHPFASIAKPNPHASHPVHQLDIPKVSVVIPVGPGHTDIIRDAMDSLEAQSFREWEVIVVNDSGEELDLTPWPYATVIKTAGKKGAGYARNRGTEIAKAPEIVYLDADDFLQANALERLLLARHHHPNTWVYPDMYVHRANGSIEYYACSDFTAQELWRRGIAPVTCLYTKEMWKRVGGFDENSHREDWDFHLRLAKAGICGIRLPEALLTYRHKTGQRRISGSIRKEAHTLHEKYSREELMTRCGSCGKRAKLRRGTNPPPTPANWTAKADLDWPRLEFSGGNQNDLVFKGKAGRRYLAGNNPHHKIIQVHPQDYNTLLRMRYFRPVQEEERVLLAEPEPRATPKSQWAPPVDLAEYSLKKIKELNLTNQNLVKLIELETAGKNRSTVLRHLRVEQRKRRNQHG